MIPEEFKIVSFKKENSDQCIDLMHYTIKSCYPSVYQPEVIDFFIKYHNAKDLLKKSSKGTMLLMYHSDKLVATGYLYKREVGGVYVHPDYQHKGYGKELVSGLLQIAADKKFDHVWLDATPIALNFYKSLGFSVTKECVDMLENKIPLPYYRMYKKII